MYYLFGETFIHLKFHKVRSCPLTLDCSYLVRITEISPRNWIIFRGRFFRCSCPYLSILVCQRSPVSSPEVSLTLFLTLVLPQILSASLYSHVDRQRAEDYKCSLSILSVVFLRKAP